MTTPGTHCLLALLLLLGGGHAAAQPPSPADASGCDTQLPDTAEREITRQLSIAGKSRELLIVLPKDYQSGHPHRLVFAFHGRTDTNRKVRSYFQLERAATQPTIFVYPAGTRDQKQHNHWWARHDKADALRDYALFDQALTMLQADYCIDTEQVYLIGHSLGATFVNSLGCARADQVRAITTVAGGIRRTHCAAPLAALILHNPKDDLVKIADGEKARDWLLKNNGFESDSSDPVEPAVLNCRRYGPEGDHNPIVWCPHQQDYNRSKHYYPHNWPKQTAPAAFKFFADLSKRESGNDSVP